MKKVFGILLVSLLFVGCKKKITPADVANINGYWEIEKVVFEKGKDKEYGMNESYDYFEIKNNKGFRKKVMPQLDGTFLVNDVLEKVKVRVENEVVYLDYATAYGKWSEELISISEEEFVVLNAEKKEYHYKRAAAINIVGDGKKIK
jgi:hypothetical protein